MSLLQLIESGEASQEQLLLAFTAALETRDDIDEDEKDSLFVQFCEAMHEPNEDIS